MENKLHENQLCLLRHLALYPDCLDLEGLNIYVYQPKEDPAGY